MQEKFAVEKVEELRVYTKVPQVLAQWVDYDVPSWESLVLMFPQMANDIACHAAKKNKVNELCCVLMNLNFYDDEAESVLLSALGDIESYESPAADNDTEKGNKQPSVNSLFSSPRICNSDGIPHLYNFKDVIIVEKDSNISNNQHDILNTCVQSGTKSNGLECFDLNKPDDKEDDQVCLEQVGRNDVSAASEDNEGSISIFWSDDRLPTFEGRPLD
eukprot:14870128-Ditylum_brightwellii.AAC.1